MRLSRRALMLAAAAAAPLARAAQPATLVCPLPAAPGVLVPGVSDTFATRLLGGKIYRGLMRYRPDGVLAPDLARDAELSPDRLTWRFRLREGVTWHDSGGFDADDVVFSLSRFHAALQPGLRLDRVRVETADPLSVVLHLSAPDDLPAGLLDALSLPIVPRHVHDVPGWALDPRAVVPVGSGPFRMEGWLRLVRFDWYEGPKPTLDAIDCPILPDPAARLALAEALARAGEDVPVLLAGDAAGLALVPRLRTVPGLAVAADYPPGVRCLAGLRLNPAVTPLDRPALRLALACAIDRAAVARQVWAGLARPAAGSALPGYSPLAASGHLNTAGLRPDDGGIRARLRYLHPPGVPWQTMVAVLRGALLQVGVELVAEPVSAADWVARVAAGAFEVTGCVARQAADLDAALDGMPVLWLVEPGIPVVRDRRLTLPDGVLGDFTSARLDSP